MQQLRAFLSAAREHVGYYRDAFANAGFDPRDLSDIADLRKLPFLTKELIRANTDALTSVIAGKLIRYSTGGSSGEPLTFYMGLNRVSHDVAAKWRATRWWNVDIGDPEVVLWGSPIEIGKQDRIKTIRDLLFRSHLFPAFQMSPAQMDRFLDRLEWLRPKMLFGYASALALLAEHGSSRRRDMGKIGVQVTFATGETLYPDQREVIERVFQAPVANGYGSRDAGFIAHECPSGAMHLSAEHIIVELVGPDGNPTPPGEQGEIVTTHLATGDFPFIRYRTGDVACFATEPCRCGRGLPVLREVLGRATDFIRTPSGDVMHALALIYEVRDKAGVRAFKFIQADDLSVELLLVASNELTYVVEDEIRRGVLSRLGSGAVLKLRRVDEISPEKSGKYRYVVSHAARSKPSVSRLADSRCERTQGQ